VDWKIDELRHAFGGRLVGKTRMKNLVCETILHLPDKWIAYITKNIWFISSPLDAWAFTFRGSDIKDQFLIFLSDELMLQPVSQIRHIILHEIGHVILGHKNSMGRLQSKSEIKRQEAEADQFVVKMTRRL